MIAIVQGGVMTDRKRNKMTEGRRPTRNDVAALAGVSSAVVSYVMNDGPRPVADRTRQRVLEAVAALDYRPNEIARSLAGLSTRTIGLIVPTLSNPVWAELAMGLTDLLEDESYALIVCDVETRPENDAVYANMLASKRVDGVVIVPTVDPEPVLKILEAAGIPAIVFEKAVDSAVSVVTDAELCARIVTEYLLGLGHRRIGLLREHVTAIDSWQRINGYTAALTEAGLEVDPQLIATAEPSVSGRIVEGSLAAARAILTARPRPTAVIAHNDMVAIGVLSVAREMGLRVPEDLSIVGCDDVEAARYTDPPITTLPLEPRNWGRVTARLLLDIMAGVEPPMLTVLLPRNLVIRGSSGPPPDA